MNEETSDQMRKWSRRLGRYESNKQSQRTRASAWENKDCWSLGRRCLQADVTEMAGLQRRPIYSLCSDSHTTAAVVSVTYLGLERAPH